MSIIVRFFPSSLLTETHRETLGFWQFNICSCFGFSANREFWYAHGPNYQLSNLKTSTYTIEVTRAFPMHKPVVQLVFEDTDNTAAMTSWPMQ